MSSARTSIGEVPACSSRMGDNISFPASDPELALTERPTGIFYPGWRGRQDRTGGSDYRGNRRGTGMCLRIADVHQNILTGFFSQCDLHALSDGQGVSHVAVEDQSLRVRSAVGQSDNRLVGLPHVGLEECDVLHPPGSYQALRSKPR